MDSRYTVIGVIVDGTLRPAATLRGDVTELLCDAGESGAWAHVVRARTWQAARQAAIDTASQLMTGEAGGQMSVSVAATVDRRSGRWRDRLRRR